MVQSEPPTTWSVAVTAHRGAGTARRTQPASSAATRDRIATAIAIANGDPPEGHGTGDES